MKLTSFLAMVGIVFAVTVVENTEHKPVMAIKYLTPIIIVDSLNKKEKNEVTINQSSKKRYLKKIMAEVDKELESLKSSDVKTEIEKELEGLESSDEGGKPYKRALLDLKSTHRESSFAEASWRRPELTSKSGLHTSIKEANKPTWWEMTFPGNKKYEVGKLTYMKRTDCFL